MATEQHDNRTVTACTITWHEDRTSGRGYLTARFDDGGNHECEWPGQPINAASDSHEIADWVAAELSLDVLSVDHDGQYVHATMRQR
jgi:hypothetical protein